MELFFDLVYVFAIIQLSHLLVAHLNWEGAAQFAVLFAAIWWGWNYSAWAMNWINPQSAPGRILMMVLMALGLGIALVLPDAFGDSGLVFAGLYVTSQVLRPTFMVVCFRGTILGRNYRNLLVWSATAGIFWITGALLEADARLVVWALAVGVDYLAPRLDFRVPGLGSAPMGDWDTNAEHLGERNRLVFIIALGESILMTGFTLREQLDVQGPSALLQSAFPAVTGFVGLCLMWWNYFSIVDRTDRTHDSASTSALRGAYAYAHALMVAGAIVFAVFIELLLTNDHVNPAIASIAVAGPLLFFAGQALFSSWRGGGSLWPQARGALGVMVVGGTALMLPAMSLPLLGVAMLAALALPLVSFVSTKGISP
ncbi:low temperature requirement protein A [Nesterenkonia muleiensis]|uniref:low temperature requirement protein A n=1 Tax=Nesterenkonia muleiensis TaxID=2282648 RepID=UPI00192E3BC1|nr:low temperature requirement protein A [Nesterenkonia muleiensis]